MSQKLLFAVDFSPYTEKLLGCAGELAHLRLNRVVLLYVLKAKDYVDYGDEKNPDYIAEVQRAEKHLAALAAELEEQGLDVDRRLETGIPSEAILRVAGEEEAGLIFMGAHGKGFLDRATIGSVSDKVLKSADRPVLIQHCRVTRGDAGYTCENVCSSLFGNVLVASDFSEYADRVRPLLMDLARTMCAPVTLLHVQEGKTEGAWAQADEDYLEGAGSGKLKDLGGELSGLCRSFRTEIIKGSPPEAILAYAEDKDASLIILGAFGQRGIISGRLGRVTDRVVRGSDRPVLVLKNR